MHIYQSLAVEVSTSTTVVRNSLVSMTEAAVRNCLVYTHRSVASSDGDRFLRLTCDRSSGAVTIAAGAADVAAASRGTNEHSLAPSFRLDLYYEKKTKM